MSQSLEFSHRKTEEGAGLPASVSVFMDRPALRGQVTDDLAEAGFRLLRSGDIAELLDGEPAMLGDAVLLDCHAVDASGMAALSRLDMRVARSGAQLIVSTSLEALDDVFACFDQSAPQILVDPSRAERIVAVGRVLGQMSQGRLRELSRGDRAALLQLTQQVEAIAREIEGLSFRSESDSSGQQIVKDRQPVFRGFGGDSAREPLVIAGLPDPRLVRDLIRRRQARSRFFDAALFADPAWDMLLDLTAAYAERTRVSFTSLCIASGVPATTALRWVKQMTDAGLFERVEDDADKRRAFISLSSTARDAMARYFAETGERSLDYAA